MRRQRDAYPRRWLRTTFNSRGKLPTGHRSAGGPGMCCRARTCASLARSAAMAEAIGRSESVRGRWRRSEECASEKSDESLPAESGTTPAKLRKLRSLLPRCWRAHRQSSTTTTTTVTARSSGSFGCNWFGSVSIPIVSCSSSRYSVTCWRSSLRHVRLVRHGSNEQEQAQSQQGQGQGQGVACATSSRCVTCSDGSGSHAPRWLAGAFEHDSLVVH